MLVNPKKLKDLTIDGTEANMKRVNVTEKKPNKANVPLIIFKHLEKKQDIINLFYNLSHPVYPLEYSNLIITKMAEKIKEFFVTNAANTSILDWNQTNSGIYGFVFDPEFKNDSSLDAIRYLSVGGFNPELRETYNFKNERVNSEGILVINWRMNGYSERANQVSEAQKIQIPIFAKAIKFTLAKYKDQYTYTKPNTKTPSTNSASSQS